LVGFEGDLVIWSFIASATPKAVVDHYSAAVILSEMSASFRSRHFSDTFLPTPVTEENLKYVQLAQNTLVSGRGQQTIWSRISKTSLERC
jgi:hypothetical protein